MASLLARAVWADVTNVDPRALLYPAAKGCRPIKSATVASAPTGHATASRLATVASNTNVLNVDLKGHHESILGEAYHRNKGVTIASAREGLAMANRLAIRASSAREYYVDLRWQSHNFHCVSKVSIHSIMHGDFPFNITLNPYR